MVAELPEWYRESTETFEFYYNFGDGRVYWRTPNDNKWRSYTPVTVYRKDEIKKPKVSFGKSVRIYLPPAATPLVEKPPINFQQVFVDRHAGGWQRNVYKEWSGHNYKKQ